MKRNLQISISVLFLLFGSICNPAAAQKWSFFLDDTSIEDPEGNLDRIRAESVEFLPDGKTLVTAGYSYNGATKISTGDVRLHSIKDGSIKARLLGTPSVSYASRSGALTVSPDGKFIAAAGWNTQGAHRYVIDLFDPKRQEFLHALKVGTKPISCITFSPDSRILAAAHRFGPVELWNPKTRKMISSFTAHSEGVWAMAFSPDGKILATGNADGSISFWNPKNVKRIGQIPAKPKARGYHGAVAFSPDGKLFASCTHTRWETIEVPVDDLNDIQANGNKKGTFRLIEKPVGGTVVCLWQVNRSGNNGVTVKKQATLHGHKDHTYTLTFSPDSTLLASANSDKTLKIWNTRTNREIVTVTDHRDFVYDVAFSPDGKFFASLGRDALKLWTVGERK